MDRWTIGHPPALSSFSLQRTTYDNNNNNIDNIRTRESRAGMPEDSQFVHLPKRKPKVRTPRAKTVHPCRICADPVLADGADTAIHADCIVPARKCSECGWGNAIPSPDCIACGGTGSIAKSACPWCPPSPCVTCVMAKLLAGWRAQRHRHEAIGNCASCNQLSALPLSPLCADCTRKADEDYERYLETTA